MPEVVVLLVSPASLPKRLEEVLLDKGMFVESCEAEQASGTLLVSTPDVVIAGHEHLAEVARSVRSSGDASSMQLLILAPRGEVSKLRRNLPPQVTAVLPFDLPPAAIAVRVKTVIKKSEGSEKQASLARPGLVEKPVAKRVALTAAERKGERGKPVQKKAVASTAKTLPHIPAVPAPPASMERKGAYRPSPPPAVLKPESRSMPGASVQIPAQPQNVVVGGSTGRVSLQVPATSLSALRIAVLDEDVTRADAISSALRKSGHEVLLVSSLSGSSRWHLLRKFAPQAIVVDEVGLSRDGGAWISAFRADRFLQATPLVAIALEHAFDADEGKADLGLLTPHLDGLGRAEMTFLTEFGRGRELEVNPAQMGIARLLCLVAESGKPTTIEIESRNETLSWNIVSGSADTAELRAGAKRIELGPAQALEWALGQNFAQVLVKSQERLKLRRGVIVDELLRDAYRDKLPPEAAFHAPGKGTPDPLEREQEFRGDAPGAAARSDSIPPDSELPTRPVSLSQIPGLKPILERSVVGPPAVVENHAAATVDEITTIDENEPTHAAVVKDSVPPSSLRRNTPPGVVRPVSSAERSSKLLKEKGRWLGAAAALVLVGGGATWLLGTDRGPSGVAAAAGTSDTPSVVESEAVVEENVPAPEVAEKLPATPADSKVTPDDQPAKQEQKPGSVGSELWRVKNQVKMDDCDVLLERPLDYYTSQPEWEGEKIWKRARHQLLMGEHEAANRLMCQAAFIDPDGRASVGLGEYYLARRSLETAKEWAQYGIEQRPDSARKSKELLGDVLSQMGEPGKARELWLETMKLEPDDLPKLRTVARTLSKLGRDARRGGDAPLAERLFRRAASLDEDSAEASGGLASALIKNGEPELAERWARRTLSLDASSGDALVVLGDLAKEKGDLDAARREYQEVKRGTPAYQVAQERLEELGQ